jgi:rhodanese-related sulfurtransferase
MHGHVEVGYPQQITVSDLAEQRRNNEKIYLLDVREAWEVAVCAIPGASHVAMNEIPHRLAELPHDRPLVVFCHHGLRSAQIVAWLRAQGLSNAVNLTGGIDAWAREVDPNLPTY